MNVFRPAVPGDAAAIRQVFIASYIDQFANLYSQADLDAFLAECTVERWTRALADPRSAGRIGEIAGRVVGYALLTAVKFPGERPATALELSQLYLLPEAQGRGIGPVLLDWSIAEARARGATELVLSVFVDNRRARRLYERLGFVDIGRYDFRVGSQIDEDRLMRLAL